MGSEDWVVLVSLTLIVQLSLSLLPLTKCDKRDIFPQIIDDQRISAQESTCPRILRQKKKVLECLGEENKFNHVVAHVPRTKVLECLLPLSSLIAPDVIVPDGCDGLLLPYIYI